MTVQDSHKNGTLDAMSGRRKGWVALSPGMRCRYERAGLSRLEYESGASLIAARGHSRTPEHPSAAEQNPDRYRTYLRRRSPGMRVITREGPVIVQGLAWRERSQVGKHLNAVDSFLSASRIPSGYTSQLADFEGQTVSGFRRGSDEVETFTFETRPDWLEYYEGRGLLRFESVYESRP